MLLRRPETIAGASERAGFIDAPQIGGDTVTLSVDNTMRPKV